MLTGYWINLFKPKAVSSAKALNYVKKIIYPVKIGHAGTLDPEAEGVLPLAIGEATKLMQFLVDTKKEYLFTIKFGIKTSSGDIAGDIIQTTSIIPTYEECQNICSKFTGPISQIPPAFSAIKINGIRSYKLARENIFLNLKPRVIHIYSLKCIDYSSIDKTATFLVKCSKGTYIRTLAEDIAFSLQSLGFVIQLRRTQVGIFRFENSINIQELEEIGQEKARLLLAQKSMKIEAVLDDIPVLDISSYQAQKIRFGQKCLFENFNDIKHIWLRHNSLVVAIGSITNHCFISSRVINNN